MAAKGCRPSRQDISAPVAVETDDKPAVLVRLELDHHRMSWVMDALEDEIRKLSDGGEYDLSRIEDALGYLAAYADTVHHPLEDRMFDNVLDKGLTPAERALVLGNLKQHVDIIEATRIARRDVANVLNDIVVPLERLVADLTDYVALQRTHMRTERQQLFPLAERFLTQPEWQAIAEQFEQSPDPMFDLKTKAFERLYESIVER